MKGADCWPLPFGAGKESHGFCNGVVVQPGLNGESRESLAAGDLDWF